MNNRDVIDQYVLGWNKGNREQILNTVTDDCEIIESHGPKYSGKAEVEKWIDEWIKTNSVIHKWEVTSFYEVDDHVFFEWYFECVVENKKHSIEGMSIGRIKNGKIKYLREYRMK